ncbi:hypothetical protein HHK36_003458 [Tetracentron sinense]|uniref:Peroxisome biogenesis protein 22 n=1 Tax=Tetracentron sinense TaxID=13715 RepID=A0A834ZPB7_TETSI|nr:hypothetical protein HHK36_003458 [Tetracentron sinense]
MADSTEELVQLIKRFGTFLTVKMSNFFPISLHNLNSHSVGAIAGLALAIVFTWRLLRTPTGPQRRQPKRQAPTSSSSGVNTHPNALVSPGVYSSTEDSRAQNVIDEFFQPVKPTLGQIVRQKLSEGRKVTCRLIGVILEESSPEEIQKQATVRSSVLEVLLEITKFCDLYLMERILDDESGEKVLLALQEAGIFTSGGLVKDKVLFCSTENGRSSFVRQLEPDWHIDTNLEIISQLANAFHFKLFFHWFRGSSNISFTFLQTDQNGLLLMCSTLQHWSSSLDSPQIEISLLVNAEIYNRPLQTVPRRYLRTLQINDLNTGPDSDFAEQKKNKEKQQELKRNREAHFISILEQFNLTFELHRRLSEQHTMVGRSISTEALIRCRSVTF